DYVVTGVEARRVRVAVLSRTTTRGHPLARRGSIGPRFFLRKTPRGNGATRPVEKPPPRPAPYPAGGRQNPPRNAVQDNKQRRRSACGCKNHPQPALLFFPAKNAMAAFSAAMVAFNSVYPVFSGAGPDYGAPTRRRSRPSTRTLSVELIRRSR